MGFTGGFGRPSFSQRMLLRTLRSLRSARPRFDLQTGLRNRLPTLRTDVRPQLWPVMRSRLRRLCHLRTKPDLQPMLRRHQILAQRPLLQRPELRREILGRMGQRPALLL
jgi:hypothetical protein